MKEKKSKKFLLRRIIIIIVLILLILLLRDFLYHFLQNGKKEQTRVLWNNQLISLCHDVYVENSEIYISEEDIKNIFDHTIYYNSGDQELITTYNKHIAVMHLNQNEMILNDATIQIQGQLKEINEKLYLPISDLQIVYDIETEYAKQNNMVIINDIAQKKAQAIVLKKASIKKSKLPFSISIETVKRGDYVYVLEEAGRDKKVRTNSGNIGYIKNKKISQEQILREDLEEKCLPIQILEKYSDITQNYEKLELDSNQENVVIMPDFEYHKEGILTTQLNIQSEDYKKYLQWIEENNISLIANCKNEDALSSSFATYEQRNQIIQKIYEQVMQKQYKGICIDFEKIDDSNNFNRFLIEITPRFKESGLRVMVKANQQIETEKIKEIVDFIIE